MSVHPNIMFSYQVTTLIEKKKAQLVVIANDVDPIEVYVVKLSMTALNLNITGEMEELLPSQS